MKRWTGYEPGNLSTCKSCGEPIRWLLTPRGKYMPADASSTEDTDKEFDVNRHTSHFATCGQADFWRRRDWWRKSSGGRGGGPQDGPPPF